MYSRVLKRLTANAKLATVMGSIQHTSAKWNVREQQMKNKNPDQNGCRKN
jgi:hypothetical protein